ncbi:MAG: AAA family ATPase [Planctomycetes bacterium]|nr:AAA family ATPase [Planctomycetota bacterium]
MTAQAQEIGRRIEEEARFLDSIVAEVGKVIVGQDLLLRRMVLGLLTGGHLLLEGVPGLAKSLAVETLARTLSATFHRIQFTPDLLPADITGTPVYQQATGRFEVKKGPIFANLILADEVNRAPAKVHSALLEAMQERKVSIGETSFPLEEPFLVLATQNPIEHEGTYALPEAELDRFFLKVVVDYPSPAEEAEIVRRMAKTGALPAVSAVASRERILAARGLVNEVYVDERLVRYVLALVRATRAPREVGLAELAAAIRYGASPRASIALVLAARGNALLAGRSYATPQDVKDVARDVLRHRIILTYEAEADEVRPDDLVGRFLDRVEVP